MRTTVALLLLVASASGCSSHHSSLRDASDGTATLYSLSHAEALQLSHNALSEMFPGRKITEIKGPPSGYVTSYRMMLDTYFQQVLAIPALGVSEGKSVRGYYFEVSGSGTAFLSGSVKNSELFDRVIELAEQVSRPVAVKNWKADYSSAPVAEPPAVFSDRTAGERLKKLEQLRADKLITEDEYRDKRKKILDEM